MKRIILFIAVLAMFGTAFAANLINENIQSWTNQGSYASFTQNIAAGTVSLTDCIVANNAAESGTCSAGRVQLKATTGVIELPELSSIGRAEFHLQAGSANRSVKLQKYNGATWDDISTFTGIGTTGATYYHDLNVNGNTIIRLASPSHALYLHDIIVTDNSGSPSPIFGFSPSSLSGFTYIVGEGPSAAKIINAYGSNLDENFIITGSDNYEISFSTDSGYTDSLTIEPIEGEINRNFYVRLKAGLGVGSYNENISIQYTIAAGDLILCSGQVKPVPLPGYYVDFEGAGETKKEYASGTVSLSGLDWDMTQALIGNLDNDFYNGTKSARFSGKAASSMTMLEDKTKGAGTVGFQYRRYGTDPQMHWKVEYSTDAGINWIQLGDNFVASNEVQTFSEELNIAGNIRIRIKRITETGESLHRLNIDDIFITDYASGYDFTNGFPTVTDGTSITITGGNANYSTGVDSDIPNPTFVPVFQEHLTLIGAGPWDFTIQTTEGWVAYRQASAWYSYEVTGGEVSFQVLASKDSEIELIIGSGGEPTLPVELSHFSAIINAQNFVKITWVSQSESNLIGYNIYRNSSLDLSTAVRICELIPGTNSSIAQTYIYVDKELSQSGNYYYWLQNVDMDGNSSYHGPVSVIFSQQDGSSSPSLPFITRLENAYPNPFNPNTSIRYQIKAPGKVKIDIYNLKGQLVRSFENSHAAAGFYQINWDGRDSFGNSVSSGVYQYKMSSEGYSSSKKMVLKK